MSNRSMTPAIRVVALVTAALLTVVVGLASGSAATAAGGSKPAAAKPVAQTAAGTMTSKVVGSTSKGDKVTGSYTPLKFTEKNGHEKVRGLLHGVVHKSDGSTQTFSVIRTMKVVSGASSSGKAVSRATCNVLNLVLGPLDLNLLGLQIHLDKVVLNIVAVSGAGQLLGNLLCAIANLLNGTPVTGALSNLLDDLNQLLALLGLGL